MALELIILAATLLIGVLLGATLSERLLEARTRRQAAAQRFLNSQYQDLARQWRELESAQHAERGQAPNGSTGRVLTP
jgi:uncharacterized membrane-anchored protein YhcB (DUF1043 family)